jgi:predicted NBD/HSP70 family sugar kinase
LNQIEFSREITHMQVKAHAEVLCRRRKTVHAIAITVALWFSAHAMDPQPTGLSVPAFTAPALPIALRVKKALASSLGPHVSSLS